MSGESHYGGPLGPLIACLREVLYGKPLSVAVLEARDFYNGPFARAPPRKERSPLMPLKRIQRNGETRWQVYAQAKRGEKRRTVYVGTYGNQREAQEADEDHRTTQRRIERGELPPSIDLCRTLKQATNEWLGSLVKSKSRSHDTYRDRLNLYILPTLGDTPIARLTKSHLLKWRDELAQRFAPATVNGSLICLKSALSYFVERDWLEKSPAHKVALVESLERPYTWIQSREEITKLLVQCPGDVRDVVALALGSGLRLDELLHLHWTDVDLERRLIHVHRGKQGSAKSGKVRRVPILDCVLGMLKERALRRGGAELVFPGKPNRDGKVKERCSVVLAPGPQGRHMRRCANVAQLGNPAPPSLKCAPCLARRLELLDLGGHSIDSINRRRLRPAGFPLAAEPNDYERLASRFCAARGETVWSHAVSGSEIKSVRSIRVISDQ